MTVATKREGESGLSPLDQAAFVTAGLVVATIGVFALARTDPDWVVAHLLPGSCVSTGLDRTCEPPLQALSRGELWRVVTPSFVHFGDLRFFWNVGIQFWFGKLIERSDGHRSMLYLVIVLVASTAMIATIGVYLTDPTVPGFGGSGIACGLLSYAVVRRYLDAAFARDASWGTWCLAAVLIVVPDATTPLSLSTVVHVGCLMIGAVLGYAKSRGEGKSLGRTRARDSVDPGADVP